MKGRWRHAREQPDLLGFVASGDYVVGDPWQLRRPMWANGRGLKGKGVYGIVADDVHRIKIGRTVDLERRIADLEGACPARLRLFAWIRGPMSLEQVLHEHLREHRVHLEWFDFNEVVTAALVAAVVKFGGGLADDREYFARMERHQRRTWSQREVGETLCGATDGSVACVPPPWGHCCERVRSRGLEEAPSEGLSGQTEIAEEDGE